MKQKSLFSCISSAAVCLILTACGSPPHNQIEKAIIGMTAQIEDYVDNAAPEPRDVLFCIADQTEPYYMVFALADAESASQAASFDQHLRDTHQPKRLEQGEYLEEIKSEVRWGEFSTGSCSPAEGEPTRPYLVVQLVLSSPVSTELLPRGWDAAVFGNASLFSQDGSFLSSRNYAVGFKGRFWGQAQPDVVLVSEE